jgi:hypothetical protein
VGDWSRFRDDCLGLWRGSRAEFLGFVAWVNSVDKDIQFTSEINWEKNEVVFLDLVISINKDGFLQTDLHTKPNAKNSLLLQSSCHPPSVTRASIYGLALRVNRNCSNPEAADLRYEELAARLRQREYPETVIAAGIAKARALLRLEAMKEVERAEGGGGRQHRLVTEYDRRSSPALAGVLRANYEQMVARDQRLGRIFPNPPRPGFKRGKNVKELLCRARLPPARGGMNTRAAAADRGGRNGLTRCNKGLNRNSCGACPHITSRPSEVIKKVRLGTGVEIEVKGRMNCKTPGFIYVLWSKKAPEKAYLGSSCRRPKDRLKEHKDDIEDGKAVAVADHFYETRSEASDLVFRPVMRVKSSDRWVLRHFESKMINELNLVEEGVNRILS